MLKNSSQFTQASLFLILFCSFLPETQTQNCSIPLADAFGFDTLDEPEEMEAGHQCFDVLNSDKSCCSSSMLEEREEFMNDTYNNYVDYFSNLSSQVSFIYDNALDMWKDDDDASDSAIDDFKSYYRDVENHFEDWQEECFQALFDHTAALQCMTCDPMHYEYQDFYRVDTVLFYIDESSCESIQQNCQDFWFSLYGAILMAEEIDIMHQLSSSNYLPFDRDTSKELGEMWSYSHKCGFGASGFGIESELFTWCKEVLDFAAYIDDPETADDRILEMAFEGGKKAEHWGFRFEKAAEELESFKKRVLQDISSSDSGTVGNLENTSSSSSSSSEGSFLEDVSDPDTGVFVDLMSSYDFYGYYPNTFELGPSTGFYKEIPVLIHGIIAKTCFSFWLITCLLLFQR